jgi:release factor glutamine methyltransferase
MSNSVTIAATLQAAANRLRGAGVANNVLDAQTLLGFALGRDRTWLIVNFRETLAPADIERYESLITRRASGEPLQYITGRQEFFGLDFEVTPAVLIPRPETELMVEEVIRLCSDVEEFRLTPPVIVDVGTGSGCLAVSIAREVAGASLTAIDISAAAIEVARRNALRNGVADRIEFLVGDLFEPLRSSPEKAQIIVSNPPYIAAAEMDELQREVRDWEPWLALTDQGDGLGFYRRLLGEAPPHLEAGGYLIGEIGYRQAAALRTLVSHEIWEEPCFLTDLQGIERTFVARLRQSGKERATPPSR